MTEVDDDLKYMTLAEYAARENKSLATCKREIKAGHGPMVTQLSQRRIGIRFDHYREHADRRVRRSIAV
jgi:hypothetical protein